MLVPYCLFHYNSLYPSRSSYCVVEVFPLNYWERCLYQRKKERLKSAFSYLHFRSGDWRLTTLHLKARQAVSK